MNQGSSFCRGQYEINVTQQSNMFWAVRSNSIEYFFKNKNLKLQLGLASLLPAGGHELLPSSLLFANTYLPGRLPSLLHRFFYSFCFLLFFHCRLFFLFLFLLPSSSSNSFPYAFLFSFFVFETLACISVPHVNTSVLTSVLVRLVASFA